MKKVAFLLNYNPKSWLGGTNLIENFIECIRKFSKNKIQPVLIVRKSQNLNDLKGFKNVNIIKTDIFDKGVLQRIFYKIEILIFGKSKQIDNFFIKNKIYLISHSNALAYNFFTGKKSKIRCLSWIADFQYLHYPEFFNFKTRILRNFNIFLCSLHSQKILLSSYDAQKDLKSLSKKAHSKSAVSQFYFKSPKKNELFSLNFLKKKFHTGDKFFYLPNQYWSHKNHIVVLKALKYLKDKKNNNLQVISTGNKNDHRNSLYFDEINLYIKKNNLDLNYKYIGLVSYPEVLSLMYHSVALINPSKFEGRHSSLEQARSLGKQSILSNINIHKEQAVPHSYYFSLKNFVQLSKLMDKLWKSYSPKKNLNNFKKASKENDLNLKKYYLNWKKVVDKTIS
tara:strand:- start:13421 stop:14605 length:1185 start_codon:yes stop_codon:yes gene_type:complete